MDHRETVKRNKYKIENGGLRVILPVFNEDGEVQDYEFPAKWEVCHTCNGRGTVVNPSIDSHGIITDEFAEDPDFAESYFSGLYDIQCPECRGRTTVAEVDEDRLTEEEKKLLDNHYEYLRKEIEAEYICAMERRMGA